MTALDITRWELAATLVSSLAIGGSAAFAGPIGLIDDFSDTGLSEYTQTLVLDQNPTSDVSFISPAGALQVTKTGGTDAEQMLLLRDDFSLAVNEILRVDLNYMGTTRADIGIAVSATATPTPLVYDAGAGGTQETREDYAAVYVQADGNNLKGIYVDGTTAGPTIFAGGFGTLANGDVVGLYIRRESANDFALGYTSAAGGDTDFATQTLANAAIGTAVGIFGDVRSAATFGDLDNLRIENPNATVVSVEIDAITGQGMLINHQPLPLEFDDYEITSEQGGLNPNWSGIDGATTPGQGWDPAGGSDEFHLIELYLPEGGMELPALSEVPLGQVFDPSSGVGTAGFAMSLGLVNGNAISGPVDFVGAPEVPGDYNGNGGVDAADYTVWRDHLGQPFQLLNEDPNDANPGVVDQDDYTFWKSRFGMTLGSGASDSGGSLLSDAVPEPTSPLLLVLAVACLAIRNGSMRRIR